MSNIRKEEKANATRTTGDQPARDLATIFKALSDETRLRILKLLEHGELCVCDIVAAFDMSQPKVSFHLSTLKGAGLVKDRREGKWMHYGIDDSDLFKRLLTFSVIERIPGETMEEDRKRLEAFLNSKVQTTPLHACCTKGGG
jgi:ArsR family transcriptional regulator, arsenate/arsenite/antimonite-responsive transcriptional repressor